MSDAERLRAGFQDTLFRAASRDDVAFYRERAGAVDGPALELGCGAGRIWLELLDAGIDADGLNLSTASLSVLRENATDRGLTPRVWQRDMSAFAVDREHGLVYCPFNAIQGLTAVEDQRGLLASAYEALAPGGAFVFDTFVPGFDRIASNWGECQSRTVQFRDAAVEYRTRTEIVDAVTQTYSTASTLARRDGTVQLRGPGDAVATP